jgi:type I restriction enzyme S subunit
VEVGVSEWKECKLGDISDVRDGTHDSPKEKPEGRFLITSKHIKNGKIDFSSAYRISEEDFEQINKRSKVDKWDILFSMIGTIAETVIVDFEPDFAIKNVGLFKTGNKDLSKWIYYYLKSTDAKNEIDACLKGSTQQYITLGDLRNFPIKIPPLPEQKAIAEVLTSLDDKIDLLHKQNKTLEQLAETLFRHHFIDNAQDDWEEKPLKDVCLIRNGFAFKSESYQESGQKIIRTTNFCNGFVEPGNDVVFISDELSQSFNAYHLDRKDFLLVMVGASLGNFAVVTKDILPALQNQNMWCFRAKEENFQHYLNHAIRIIISENLHGASGSARSFFQKGSFYEQIIRVPDRKSLNDFNHLSENLFSRLELNRGQIKSLEKLRDQLLPKLMSGEVKV